MKTLALLSAVVLLLQLSGISAMDPQITPFAIEVSNSLIGSSQNQTYHTYVHFGGVLLGGMRRLRDSDQGFNFTYTEDADYGPYLQSVNGLAGSIAESTFWELLVMKPDGQTTRPHVGIGCYIPDEGDTIILNFTSL